MPRIDFTPKCEKCGSVVPKDRLFKPCLVCGFDSLEAAKKANLRRLRKMMKDEIENDRRIRNKPPGEGPFFAGQLAANIVAVQS